MPRPRPAPAYPYGKAILGARLDDGSSFGPYEIRELLSVTLFGLLYRVEGKDGSQLLWVFPDALFKDRRFANRLKAGVEKIKANGHAHVAAPIELRQIKNHWCLLYEDPGGATLSSYLEARAGERNAPDEVRFFLSQAMQAVQAMNALGISHFQITPDLLLLSDDGRLLVLGFGWLEAIDRAKFEQFVSSAIIPISVEDGPVPHATVLDVLSPELRNGESADVRSDVFSLGLLAHLLLTNERAQRDWTPPSHVRDDLEAGWDVLVRRCLEGETQARFASPAAFLDALENVENLEVAPTASSGSIGRRLEAIPLPRQVTARYNADTLLKVRLVLLGLFGLTVLGLGQLSLNIIFGGDDASQPIATRVAALELADVVLRIKPERARVVVTGEEAASYLVQDGQIGLDLRPGRHRIRIEAPFFSPQLVSVDTENVPLNLPVQLPIAWGQLTLKGLPGTTIEAVDDEGRRFFVGELGDDGTLVAVERIFARTYDFAASLGGYQGLLFEEIVVSASEMQEVDVTLQPIPPVVEVRSNPAGASVMLGGVAQGVTPLRLEGMKPGEAQTIELSYPGLRPARRTIELSAGEERVLDFGDLQVRSGLFELAVTVGGEPLAPAMVEDLVVALGSTEYPRNPELSLNLKEGTYEVSVGHPQLFATTQQIAIADGETVTLRVDLRPRPGRLFLQLPTEGRSRLLVNNQPVAPDLQDGAYPLPPGERVTVTVELIDHFVEREQFFLRAAEVTVWTPQMRSIPGPVKGEDFAVPYQNMSLLWLEPGSVIMGSRTSEAERRPEEGPRTEARLSQGFWMAAHEVTQAQFQRLMGENPSQFKGARMPVERVTYAEAQAFAARLTARERQAGRLPEGMVYRLPTEAEWEYGARAGTTTPFSFGRAASQADGQFSGRYPREFGGSSSSVLPPRSATDVGSFAPNAFGLYDVHGNVAELVLDAFYDRHLGGVRQDPVRLTGGLGATLRGGSWQGRADRARSAVREAFQKDIRSAHVGFRVVLAPPVTVSNP